MWLNLAMSNYKFIHVGQVLLVIALPYLVAITLMLEPALQMLNWARCERRARRCLNMQGYLGEYTIEYRSSHVVSHSLVAKIENDIVTPSIVWGTISTKYKIYGRLWVVCPE